MKKLSFSFLATLVTFNTLLAQTSDASNEMIQNSPIGDSAPISNLVSYLGVTPKLMMDPAALEEGTKAVGEALGMCGRKEIVAGASAEVAERSDIINAIPSSSSANQVLRLRGGGPKKFQPTGGPKSTGDTSDEEELDQEDEDVHLESKDVHSTDISIDQFFENEICENIYTKCLVKVADLLRSKPQFTDGLSQAVDREWEAAKAVAEGKLSAAVLSCKRASREVAHASTNRANDHEIKELRLRVKEAKLRTANDILTAIKTKGSTLRDSAENTLREAQNEEAKIMIELAAAEKIYIKTLIDNLESSLAEEEKTGVEVATAIFTPVDEAWKKSGAAFHNRKNVKRGAVIADAFSDVAKEGEKVAGEAYSKIVMGQAMRAVRSERVVVQWDWDARVEEAAQRLEKIQKETPDNTNIITRAEIILDAECAAWDAIVAMEQGNSVNSFVEYAPTSHQSSSNCDYSSSLQLPISISYPSSPAATAVSPTSSLQPRREKHSKKNQPIGQVIQLEELVEYFVNFAQKFFKEADKAWGKNSRDLSNMKKAPEGPVKEAAESRREISYKVARNKEAVAREVCTEAANNRLAKIVQISGVDAQSIWDDEIAEAEEAVKQAQIGVSNVDSAKNKNTLKRVEGIMEAMKTARDAQWPSTTTSVVSQIPCPSLVVVTVKADPQNIQLNPRNIFLGVGMVVVGGYAAHAAITTESVWNEKRVQPGCKILKDQPNFFSEWAHNAAPWIGCQSAAENKLLSKLACADEVQGVDGAKKLEWQELLDASGVDISSTSLRDAVKTDEARRTKGFDARDVGNEPFYAKGQNLSPTQHSSSLPQVVVDGDETIRSNTGATKQFAAEVEVGKKSNAWFTMNFGTGLTSIGVIGGAAVLGKLILEAKNTEAALKIAAVIRSTFPAVVNVGRIIVSGAVTQTVTVIKHTVLIGFNVGKVIISGTVTQTATAIQYTYPVVVNAGSGIVSTLMANVAKAGQGAWSIWSGGAERTQAEQAERQREGNRQREAQAAREEAERQREVIRQREAQSAREMAAREAAETQREIIRQIEAQVAQEAAERQRLLRDAERQREAERQGEPELSPYLKALGIKYYRDPYAR